LNFVILSLPFWCLCTPWLRRKNLQITNAPSDEHARSDRILGMQRWVMIKHPHSVIVQPIHTHFVDDSLALEDHILDPACQNRVKVAEIRRGRRYSHLLRP